ncbi:MAG: hypothetical protein ABFS12_09105 [Bacteroidota bacterium]
MNFTKNYILQVITLASNNLRLSSDRIETVTFLKDYILNSEDIAEEIALMKTKTELSKFAIKLGEAYKYIESANIDFLKLTDTFKDHSNTLIIELSNVLDIVNLEQLRNILTSDENSDEIAIDLGHTEATKDIPTDIVDNAKIESDEQPEELIERDSLKEEIILEEVTDPNRFDFADFEETILKPVAKLEKTLKGLVEDSVSEKEIVKLINVLKKNAKLSDEIGFTILAEMHTIFYTALEKISEKKIKLDTSLIESMRACLIVIVAIVRSKDVDINTYINRAEKLGKYLKIS